MKKLLLGALLLLSTLSFSQTSIFSEDFTDTNLAYPITFTGDYNIVSGDNVNNNLTIPNYLNASGGNYVTLYSVGTDNTNQYIMINNINTNNGFINKLNFGMRIGHPSSAGSYPTPILVVEQSTDGINWFTINFIQPPTNYWVKASINTNIINFDNLYLRFRLTNGYSNSVFNISIDDVSITQTTLLSTFLSNNLEKISCFPNPSSDIIYFNNTGKIDYVLYDLTGKELIQGFDDKININSFVSGLYVLKLKNDFGNKIIKIIKK